MALAPEMASTQHKVPNKGRSVSIPQYQVRENPARIQHEPSNRHGQSTPHTTLSPAGVAMLTLTAATVPAAFWAAVAWFVSDWRVAALAAIVVLIGSIFTLGFSAPRMRSRHLMSVWYEIETSDPAPLALRDEAGGVRSSLPPSEASPSTRPGRRRDRTRRGC